MKRVTLLLLAVLLMPTMAFAGSQPPATSKTFTPSDSDLDDLDHNKYYTWGMDWKLPEGKKIASATLFFDNIKNWDNNPNILYVHLLPQPYKGVKTYTDNEGGGDAFNGQGVKLFERSFTSSATDYTYTFTLADLAAFTDYISDTSGRFGFGFDPDCHFYNDGIKLTVNWTTAPEPISSAMFLLGAGAMVVRRIRRKA